MSNLIEIDFDTTGAPYTTLYFSEGYMYLDSPNGRVSIRIPDSLYKELKKYAEESSEE